MIVFDSSYIGRTVRWTRGTEFSSGKIFGFYTSGSELICVVRIPGIKSPENEELATISAMLIELVPTAVEEMARNGSMNLHR